MFKAILTLSVALFFTLIFFNNVTDYSTNFLLVKQVISLESVTAPKMQWRAIQNPLLQQGAYLSIITWEGAVSALTWIGGILLLRKKGGRRLATLGLIMGFVLFMVGFVIIAGEWFTIWATPFESLQMKALVLSILLGGAAAYVKSSPESA